MAASQLLVFHSGQTVTDGTTRFIPIGGHLSTLSATEADVENPVRTAGTASKLFVRVTQNGVNQNSTLTLRQNRADTSLVATITASTTGEFEDTTNSVSLAATDEIDWEATVPAVAGTNTITISVIGMLFTPTDTSKTVTVLGGRGPFNFATASATRYLMPQEVQLASTESPVELYARGDYTHRNLSVEVSANARTTNTVFVSRKNGADGALTVTYGNVETGVKEDATNSDTLTSGDRFCWKMTTDTGTQTITVRWLVSELESAASRFQLFAVGGVAPLAQLFNVTNYSNPGRLSTPTTTEANAQFKSRLAHTARSLQASVSANTIATSATVIKFRKNTADGNQSLSYAAAETGAKVDASNTDEIADGDVYNYQIVTPNTSGTFTLRFVGHAGDVVSPVTAAPDTGALTASGAAAALGLAVGMTLGALGLTGEAPSALSGSSLSPDTGALAISGAAPALVEDVGRAPSQAALALDGQAPSVSLTFEVPAGSLGLDGQAPSLQFVVELSAGSAMLAGQAPTVSEVAATTPDTAALVVSGQAPSLLLEYRLAPAAGALTLDGQVPARVSAEFLQPGAGAIALDGQAPTVSAAQAAAPGAGALALDGQAAALATDVALPQGALAIDGQAPTAPVAVYAQPAAAALALDGVLATVDNREAIPPQIVRVTGTHVPTVDVTGTHVTLTDVTATVGT